MAIPVVYHPGYRDYDFGPEHPFTPVRLTMLFDLLDALGVAPEDPITPEAATREEVLSVHDEALVARVEAASRGEAPADARQYGLGTEDVPVFDGMDAAARTIVGGTLTAARRVADGAAATVLQMGGGLHHAQRTCAGGFCVYNDLAVAIWALRQQDFRVAYLDIDVHHGDGVQQLFYEDPDVLTISLHESGRYLYPGTGFVRETGRGEGQGYSLNVPLAPYTEDASYLETFERVVPYALERFEPDVLLVQCGADAHFRDPLADLLLTTRAYEQLFTRIVELAFRHAEGRLICTFGGGYDPDATTRLWAMLYLLLQDLDLPEDMPADWIDRWEERLDLSMTRTLHDPEMDFSIPRREAIEEQNRQTSKGLLERIAPLWY
jgi:acetoin utilization protein AcuC